METKNMSLIRRMIVANARDGEVCIHMKRGNGTIWKFNATLSESARICAEFNSQEYYRSIGTTKAKIQRERRKRKEMLENVRTYLEYKLYDLIYFWVVDTEEFRWRRVSMESLVGFTVTGR